jgi:hypothetical protein
VTSLLQSLVAVLVVVLLARSVRPAWRERRLAVLVWGSIRPHHVLGSVALLVLVVATAVALLQLVPLTGLGLGTLVGFDGNAVFAPLDAADRSTGGSGLAAPAPTPEAPGPDWRLLGLAAPFLALLLGLFPSLAYREEVAFRRGLEHASLARQATVALRFGLIHLVMLVPLAAALAVGVAGFAYGRIYLRAYARAEARARRAADDAPGSPLAVAPPRAQLRAEAVLAATTWHTTFNSLVVLVVFAALIAGSL